MRLGDEDGWKFWIWQLLMRIKYDMNVTVRMDELDYND
jgi:hypothetical protein